MHTYKYPPGYKDFPEWLQLEIYIIYQNGISLTDVMILHNIRMIWIARACDDINYTPGYGGPPPQPFTLYSDDGQRVMIPDDLAPQVIEYLEGVVHTDQRPVEVRLQEAQECLDLYTKARQEAIVNAGAHKDKVALVFDWPIKTLTAEIQRLRDDSTKEPAAGEQQVEKPEHFYGDPEDPGRPWCQGI